MEALLSFASPLYKQKGVESSDTAALFFQTSLVITAALFAWEGYISLRQRTQYAKSQIPPAVLAAIDLLPSGKEELLQEVQAKLPASQAYGYEKNSFGLVQSSLFFLLGMAALLLGALPYFYDLATQLLLASPWPALAQGDIAPQLAFASIFYLYSTALSLPFSLYRTFVVEQRHGFNKQSMGGFFKDLALESMLAAVIGLPLLAAVIKIVQWGGPHFYLYVSVFLVAVQLLLLLLGPHIMALFNTFAPLKEGSLRSKIFALAGSLHFPLGKLFVVDGSRRSSHSNAYMYGLLQCEKDCLVRHPAREQAGEEEEGGGEGRRSSRRS